MTRALVVMIATHDSDLIVRGAVTIGTSKQPECIVRRIGHATRSHVRTFTLQWSCTLAKARGIDLHWHVIIFGQLSWYGMPARQITLQNRRDEK